jgi:hypothetical protein
MYRCSDSDIQDFSSRSFLFDINVSVCLNHRLFKTQPGPRELPMQCFIKRNKKNSTFLLYLGFTNSPMDKGKFLMAARRFRRGPHTEYIISLDAEDLSQGSNAYMGKLR